MTQEALALIAIFIQTISILIPALLILNELRLARRQELYNNIMQLENEISDNVKNIWGIPDDNKIKLNGKIVDIDIKKLIYMVKLLDVYALSRGHTLFYNKNAFTQDTIVYKMFLHEVYRDYWRCIVRDVFYDESVRYKNVIDKTIECVEKKLLNS